MKRVSIGVFTAAALTLGAAACSSTSGFQSVAVTKNPSVVASCEKIAEVKAKPGAFDESDIQTQLTRAAQNRGANTVLLASDDANKGTAYKCSMPELASTGKSSSSTGTH
ncbi:MAG TPA: hypothetical protein VMH79_10380 [Thermoanaerobaculia bacterium]|nr:hypothetical protein [Thermoanaerobaculia bacterium]